MSALRVAGWVALVAALIAAGAASLPLEPLFPSFSLDTSFGATLHYQAAGHLVGTRLISTCGPLGFVYYPIYFPDTYRSLVVLQALFAVPICWALAWVGWASSRSPWGATLAVAASVPFLATPDVRFTLLPLLALLIVLPRDRTAHASLRLALGAAVGLAALVKVTFLTASVVALGPLTAGELLARRRVPLTAAAAVVAALAGWSMLGLGWADWVAYVGWSTTEITPGYSSAMQFPSSPALVAHAAAVSVVTLVAGALLARRRARDQWWMIAVGQSALLFLVFKAGFVRADVHVFITCFVLVICGVVLALLWGQSLTRIAVGTLLVAALPGSLLWHAVDVETGPPHVLFRPLYPADLVRRVTAIPNLFLGEALAEGYARRTAEMRRQIPLPRLRGPVDIYSYEQGLLLAHGVEFRPRPVFQSYMAYTPRLARMNAEFLAGDRAPEWVLFRPETIDGRLPALDDAASWPLLFARYAPVGVAGPFALLERRRTALPWRFAPIGRMHTATDTPIAVPPGLVWARIDLRETFADGFVETLFAGPYVFFDLTFADGPPARYRLVPAIARDGFLLSPLIGSTQDMLALMQRGASWKSNRAVKELRVGVASPFANASGPRAVDVEFLELVIDSGQSADLDRPTGDPPRRDPRLD